MCGLPDLGADLPRFGALPPLPAATDPATAAAPNRIAEWRRGRGLTQAEVAEQVDAHWVTISKLERGEIGLSLEWMMRFAKVFGVTLSDLLPEAHP